MRFACSVQYPQNTSRHWRTMALRAHLAPVALALSTLALSNPAWSAQAPKPAEAATREANAALLKELPFSDKTSFELAHKGFVAPLPDAMIKGA